MEIYNQLSAENTQALDYTLMAKTDQLSAKLIDSPVLDLSCKRESLQDHQIGSYSLSPVSLEAQSLSPASHDTHEHQPLHHKNYDDGRGSPESRTYMVTPPSESESPSKRNFPPICPQLHTPLSDIAHRYPLIIPMNSAPLSPTPNTPTSLATPNSDSMISQVPSYSPASPTTQLAAENTLKYDNAVAEASKKAPRPFKAYPKDPLALTVGPSEFIYDQTSKDAYNEFRKRMLDSVRKTNEGTNIKMRRLSKNSNLPTSTIDDKDAAYWERRRKNNEAAKRSRDARRAKEDEIAIRAAFLEQENMKLKYEVVALRNETARLRCMVYST